MKILFTSILLVSLISSNAQSTLKGIIVDGHNDPVFAANVYLKSSPQTGTNSDLNGKFQLLSTLKKDTLIVSFISYENTAIPIQKGIAIKNIKIVLKEMAYPISQVIIKAKDPISEKFSVLKLNKMDIYLSPISQGDPLKAITALPASTNSDETANPSLRGSNSDQSRVILNGVPIYNPVRASQLNNQGFFSLFNPEIIDNLYVYASNPPLSYGNTSAGLVEIQSINKIQKNQLQVASSLASTGILLSQKIKGENTFIQLYGNHQFSNAMIGIQRNAFPYLKHFKSDDFGVNTRIKLGKKLEFNSFNYFINEAYASIEQLFTYKGSVITSNQRFFTINNLSFYTKKGVLKFNSSFNKTHKEYSFGTIHSNNYKYESFTSINYKLFIKRNLEIEVGINKDYQRNNFKNKLPIVYYAISPSSPNITLDTLTSNRIIESYTYLNWRIDDKWTISSGLRSNIKIANQTNYLSKQFGLKYKIDSRQSILMSAGNYHNYATPNYYKLNHNLLSSNQIAIDYSLIKGNTHLTAAFYLKNEFGNQMVTSHIQTNTIKTKGIEFYIERRLNKHFKYNFSNTFIHQTIRINEKQYRGPKNFNYFFKANLQYHQPKSFTFTLNFTSRPGNYFTPIKNATFNQEVNFYEPIYNTNMLSQQFSSYSRFDFSINKFIKFKKQALITFITINNLLNKRNQKHISYISNYTSFDFTNYALRSIYFGTVWQLNY